MAADIRYRITAEDNTKQGTRQAKQNLSKFSADTKKISSDLGKAFLGAFSATAILKTLGTIGKAVKKLADESLKAYREQEQAVNRLNAALRNNPYNTRIMSDSLQAYASALQRVSIYGDEVIIQQTSMLGAMGLSEKQIRDVLDAATNLASSGLMSLESATRNIAKTFGGLSGELGELIPDIRNLTAEQLKAGDATKVVISQFEGMNEAVRESSEGIRQAFQNAWGDLNEQRGQRIAKFFDPILEKMTDIVEETVRINDEFAAFEEWRNGGSSGGGDATGSDLFGGFGRTLDQVLNPYNERLTAALDALGTSRGELLQQGLTYSTANTLSRLPDNGQYDVQREFAEELRNFLNVAKWQAYGASAAAAGNMETPEQRAQREAEAIAAAERAAEKAARQERDAAWIQMYHDLSEGNSEIYKALAELAEVESELADLERLRRIATPDNGWTDEHREILLNVLATLRTEREVLEDQLKLLRNPPTDYDPIDVFSNPEVGNSQYGVPQSGFKPPTISMEERRMMYSRLREADAMRGTDSSSFFQKMGEWLTNAYNNTDQFLSGAEGMAFGGQGIMAQLGPELSAFTGGLTEVTAALGPMAVVAWALERVFEGVMSVIGPAIQNVIAPLLNVLFGIGQIIGQMLMPIMAALGDKVALVAEIIFTIITPLLDLLTPSLALFGSLMELTTPLLKMLAVAIEVLMSPIRWLGEAFTWVADHLTTAIQNAVIFIENLFRRRANDQEYVTGPGAFTQTTYGDGALAERIAEIWNSSGSIDTGTTWFSDLSSDAMSLNLGNNFMNSEMGFSGYPGMTQNSPNTQAIGRDITMNFYNQNVITGDEQIEDLAILVRDKILEVEALGR